MPVPRRLAVLFALAVMIMLVRPLVTDAASGTRASAAPRPIAITAVHGVDEGAVLAGTVFIGVETSGPVDHVVFRLAGAKDATWTEHTPPWWLGGNTGEQRRGWDTTTVPDGAYTLAITAVGAAGETTSVQRTFRVANLRPALISRVVGLENDAVLSGTVFIGVEAKPTVEQVVFELDGPQVLTWTEHGAPWWLGGNDGDQRHGWNTTTVPNGYYALSITAGTADQQRDTVRRTLEVRNPDGGGGGGDGDSSGNPFSRPTLVNPVTVVLSNANPRYIGNSNEDVRVVVQEILTVPAKIANVHNLVLIGGEFSITRPLPTSAPCGADMACNQRSAMQHKALSLANIHGTAWLEGIFINGTNGNLSEGLQIWGSAQATVIIVNSRFEEVRLPRNDWHTAFYNHPDLIQLMAGSLFLHNVTLSGSDYQGIYAHGEHGNRLGEVRLHRVLFHDVRRQALFLNTSRARQANPVWTLAEQVYYQGTARAANDARNTILTARHNGQANLVTPDYLRWTTMAPAVLPGATVWLRTPSQGDFAPVDQVGQHYNPAFFNTPCPDGAC